MLDNDRCNCCGTKCGNIVGDTDHDGHRSTSGIYGYLCSRCTKLRAIAGTGKGFAPSVSAKDISRVRNMLAYLERTRFPDETRCKTCGNPIPRSDSPRKREFCSDACKQREYRSRKSNAIVTQVHDQDAAQLSELEALRTQVTDQAHTIDEQTGEIAELRERIDIERHYLEDTTPRYFKSWLKKQPPSPWRDRFLSDQLVPMRGSRAQYEAYMRRLHCSEEEHEDFVRLWKLMLLERD